MSLTPINDSTLVSQASLKFIDLEPSTSYSIFCSANSLDGSTSLLGDVLATRFIATTLCCKEIIVSLNTKIVSSVADKAGILHVVSVGIRSVPSKDLVLNMGLVMLTENGNLVSNSTLIPGSLSFESTIPLQPLSFLSLTASTMRIAINASTILLQVTKSGNSSNEYEVIYSRGDSMKILGDGDEPPTPILVSSIFATDGQSLIISFDSATDFGRVTTPIFSCSELLVFYRANEASCSWKDSATIIATLDIATSLNIGIILTLKVFLNTTILRFTKILIITLSITGDPFDVVANKIAAKCLSSDTTKCNSWKRVESKGTITIRGPDVIISPTVIIAAQSVISKCDNLKLDISYSKGSAGREWIGWEFSIIDVSSETPKNLTKVANYLNSHFSLSPLYIPAGMLSIGSYSLTLSLVNFLGASSQTSHDLLVVSLAVPTVSIGGTSLRQIYRKDPIKLQAKAYVRDCSIEGINTILIFSNYNTNLTKGKIL